MLVLTRRDGEAIIINEVIKVVVTKHGTAIRVAIDAPKEIPIRREELAREAA